MFFLLITIYKSSLASIKSKNSLALSRFQQSISLTQKKCYVNTSSNIFIKKISEPLISRKDIRDRQSNHFTIKKSNVLAFQRNVNGYSQKNRTIAGPTSFPSRIEQSEFLIIIIYTITATVPALHTSIFYSAFSYCLK